MQNPLFSCVCGSPAGIEQNRIESTTLLTHILLPSGVWGLRWWRSMLWKSGHPSVDVRPLGLFHPSPLSPSSFLVTLPAQLQRPRDKHIQVKQPLFLSDRKWLRGSIVDGLETGGRRGDGGRLQRRRCRRGDGQRRKRRGG